MADGKKGGEEFSLGCGTLLMLLIGSCAIWAIVTPPSSKQTTAATQVVLWSGEDSASVTPLSTLQKGAHIKAYDTSDDEKWVRISEYAEATSQAEWIRADHIANASPKETMYVSARRLNVRTRPTTEAETNEQLEQGDEVTIFEVTPGGWARISSLEGMPGKRTADWVFAKHLSSDPVEPPKPVQTADKQKAQDSPGPSYVREAEFFTMQRCLESIPEDARSPINIIARDTPSIVSGRLANGETFACQRKETGSRGTYYVGWYGVR